MIESIDALIWLPIGLSALGIGVLIGQRAFDNGTDTDADDSENLPTPLNRQDFFAAGKDLLSRSSEPCLLAVVDIDSLRSLEQYAGLQAADNAVIIAIQQLDRHLPLGWLLGRTGDSRFAILAPFSDLRLIKRQLGAVVATIADAPLCQDGKIIELDARCGYALTSVNPVFDTLYLNAGRAAEQARTEGSFEPVFAAAHTQLSKALAH